LGESGGSEQAGDQGSDSLGHDVFPIQYKRFIWYFGFLASARLRVT
jgi:hypothetical protein